MDSLGALYLSIAIIIFGFCLDNGLTNIAKSLRVRKKGAENADSD